MKIFSILVLLFSSVINSDPEPRTVILLVSDPPRYSIPPSAATFWEEEYDSIIIRASKSDLIVDDLIAQMKDTSLYQPSTLSHIDSVDYFSHEIAIIRQRPGKSTDTIYASSDWSLFKKGRVHMIDNERKLRNYIHYLFFER